MELSATYLVGTGGLAADKVRALSYGEVQKRQVVPNAKGSGDSGLENRRVTLVIEDAAATDHVGDAVGARRALLVHRPERSKGGMRSGMPPSLRSG